MIAFIDTPLFHLMITLLAYWLSNLLFNKFRYKILHPGIVSILVLILFLKLTDTSFQDYNDNTSMLSFWLGPSVVALGLPLYLYIRHLQGNFFRFFLAMIAGSLIGIISVVVIAKLLGASDIILYSLAPKSVTTPIAMEISEGLGGIPSLTIVVVFITGFVGALFGWGFLSKMRINDEKAIGIAMGAASHAIGTAEIVKNGEKYGAYGALGMVLNGVLTAVFAPIIMPPLIHLLCIANY
ncbi:MAG: LrgB family protein [Flavobacteriaceae bacterium]|jgi:predicted murein hydrolase (TIGR00659 family)|nr:LrgB family protein [Flavobacteriaceae bacterium]